MSIAPILRTVDVRPAPARAFELFTAQMGRWWPSGRTIGRQPHVAIVVEPRVGGRWYERDADGAESTWGVVRVWQPPTRVVLGWQLDARFRHDPAVETEVELTFAPLPDGGTRVTLEHRHLERLGVDAADLAGKLRGGWQQRLADYVAHADAAAARAAAAGSARAGVEE